MPRNEGQFQAVKGTKGTTYSIRFRLPDGRRISEKVGQAYGPNAIDRREAEARAERILAQVKLGAYRTKAERAADEEARRAGRETPLFAPFADEWLERRRVLGGRRGTGLSASGDADLSWRLGHLNGWFAGMRLDEITEEEVEAFAAAKRAAKVGEGGVGPGSLNKILSTGEAILATAVRFRKIDRNPFAGFRVHAPVRVADHLSTAAQITALLNAAGDLDRGRRGRQGHGRALLATLLFGGLRIGEALALTWRDLDLSGETALLRVRDGKTENAARTVYLQPPLRAELAKLKERRGGDRDDLIFGTATGKPDGRSNVARRVLHPAVAAANRVLEEAEAERIPDTFTLHGFRHTYCSVMILLGEPVDDVADQAGHSDPAFTLKRYRHRIERRDGEPVRLRALFFGRPVPVPDGGLSAVA